MSRTAAAGAAPVASVISPPQRSPRCDRLWARLREDRGSAVVEFPLVAVLIVVIALAVIQSAVVLHTRNLMIDAAVQGAHHAARVGAEPADGADRARRLLEQRFGEDFASSVQAQSLDGVVTVRVSGTLPLVGMFGLAGALQVQGRALDEESW